MWLMSLPFCFPYGASRTARQEPGSHSGGNQSAGAHAGDRSRCCGLRRLARARATPVIYHIGQLVQVGSLVLTGDSVTYPPPTAYDTPDPGKKFLGVNVTIQNRGTENQVIFSA